MMKKIFFIILLLWSTQMVKATELNNYTPDTAKPRIFYNFEEAMILSKNEKNIVASCWNDYGGCYALNISVKNFNCSKLTFLRVIQYLSYVEWALELDWKNCVPLSEPKELLDGPEEGLDSGVGYEFWEYGPKEVLDHNDVWVSKDILEFGITPEMILKVLGGEEDYPLPTPID